MSEQSKPLTIDVVSDVVCPWCYLGKKRLERALAQETGEPIAVHWRPYQLDPSIPKEGLERRAYMINKFGNDGRIEAAHERLKALGRRGRHRLRLRQDRARAQYARRASADPLGVRDGRAGRVVDRLFKLYFEEGRDIGDRALADRDGGRMRHGSRDRRKAVRRGADEEEVRAEIAEAQRLGVTGVPFFIFAQRFGVPGAQDAEVLSGAIAQARKSLAGNRGGVA